MARRSTALTCTVLLTGAVPWSIANGQTTATAFADVNLVVTGPQVTSTGPNASAFSSASTSGADAEASADAGGTVRAHTFNMIGSLPVNSGSDASLRYSLSMSNPATWSLPLEAVYSASGKITVEMPTIPSTLPQFVATPLFAYSVIDTTGGGYEVRGNYQEEWQNGSLRSATFAGSGGAPFTTFRITPVTSAGGQPYSLSAADLGFLGVTEELSGISAAQVQALSLSDLSAEIEGRIATLGLPSAGLPAGVSVSVLFDSTSTTTDDFSEPLDFSGGVSRLLIASTSAGSNSGGGNTSSDTEVGVYLSGITVDPDALAGLLLDPDYRVDGSGVLTVADGNGGYEPVVVRTDDPGGGRTFTVFVPEPAITSLWGATAICGGLGRRGRARR